MTFSRRGKSIWNCCEWFIAAMPLAIAVTGDATTKLGEDTIWNSRVTLQCMSGHMYCELSRPERIDVDIVFLPFGGIVMKRSTSNAVFFGTLLLPPTYCVPSSKPRRPSAFSTCFPKGSFFLIVSSPLATRASRGRRESYVQTVREYDSIVSMTLP